MAAFWRSRSLMRYFQNKSTAEHFRDVSRDINKGFVMSHKNASCCGHKYLKIGKFSIFYNQYKLCTGSLKEQTQHIWLTLTQCTQTSYHNIPQSSRKQATFSISLFSSMCPDVLRLQTCWFYYTPRNQWTRINHTLTQVEQILRVWPTFLILRSLLQTVFPWFYLEISETHSFKYKHGCWKWGKDVSLSSSVHMQKRLSWMCLITKLWGRPI